MSANQIIQIEVPLEQAGQRLDRFLATLEFIPSRSRAAELIHRNLVTLAGQTLKASFKVSAGCTLRIELPAAEPSTLQPLDAPLDILYEDDDLIVVNKPSGLVVHPAAGHAQDTLVNILLHHTGALSMGFSEQRPGIVHRLDRDTSGILVAKMITHTTALPTVSQQVGAASLLGGGERTPHGAAKNLSLASGAPSTRSQTLCLKS